LAAIYRFFKVRKKSFGDEPKKKKVGEKLSSHVIGGVWPVFFKFSSPYATGFGLETPRISGARIDLPIFAYRRSVKIQKLCAWSHVTQKKISQSFFKSDKKL
jgi:hypothetical protein